ncbi:MAG: purine-binding chemotaxis protein CheW [Betaproteobacteria bacterium]|nr:MAG: purine-binding chemotaxis protein CheW [Betaproteobacteria bacterium]
MSTYRRVVVFTLDRQRYGLPLRAVERVVRMVDVTSLPRAPDVVLGVINVQGRVIPVVNLRRRFHLPERDTFLTGQLVIAHTARRPVALIVDAASGVLEYSADEAVGARDIVPGIEHVEGVVKLADGLVLIHDLDKFLSLEEETALDRAIDGA